MSAIETIIKYPTIKYQNSFNYTGEELERMKRTPIAPSTGAGSQLENLGAKVNVRYNPEEVAVQSDLAPHEQRARIEALHKPFNEAVCRVVGKIARIKTDDSEVVRSLARIRELKSQILSGGVVYIEASDKQLV